MEFIIILYSCSFVLLGFLAYMYKEAFTDQSSFSKIRIYSNFLKALER